LEKEEILQQFDQIEQRIGRLVEVSKSLEATNEELGKKIELLEKELKEKNQSEKSFLDERDLIRSKVDNLLARLQEITETST
jgi:chromosome segregation ATPase